MDSNSRLQFIISINVRSNFRTPSGFIRWSGELTNSEFLQTLSSHVGAVVRLQSSDLAGTEKKLSDWQVTRGSKILQRDLSRSRVIVLVTYLKGKKHIWWDICRKLSTECVFKAQQHLALYWSDFLNFEKWRIYSYVNSKTFHIASCEAWRATYGTAGRSLHLPGRENLICFSQ